MILPPLFKALSGVFLCLAAGAANAETVFGKSVRYYSIGGRTAAEVDRELSKRGPLTRSTGARHPGSTEIRFGGEASYLRENGRCRVADVKVTLTTKITLPRWKYRRQADAGMALIWDTLAADIKRHEERHAEIARNHARTLEATLKALRPAADCATLRQRTAEATEKAIAAHDAEQARFDRVEALNFEKRMLRLLRYKSGATP